MEDIDDLLKIMARLRDPDGGCPWDLEQRFETIAPYTIEEAYEVEDAIARVDWDALRDELGDLLLQVVYHAQMAAEVGHFRFADVVRAICEKLVRRHPHVFGDGDVGSAEAQVHAWDEHKAKERALRAEKLGRPAGALDDVPHALPALLRAGKLLRRAARAGLDDAADARASVASQAGAADEHGIGDLLLACVRLANAADVDPEAALRAANRRFEQRVHELEQGG